VQCTNSAFTLRPYQEETLAAIEAAENRGVRRQLVNLPTGTGKTVVFAELIRRRPGRALVLAHRDELNCQAVAKLTGSAPGLSVGVVKAERDEVGAEVVVASVQTLARRHRLERLVPNFTTVVVDEAHHSAAASYRRILDHVRAGEPSGPLLVGVTATPDRGDGRGLESVYEEIVYQRSLPEMVAAGFLCDLRAIQIRTRADLASLHVSHGDFSEGEAGEALMRGRAPELVAEAYVKHAAGRRALVFTPTVALAHAMTAALNAAGVPAEALDASTPTQERRAILGRFHAGETTAVANCGVLIEGYDEPAIDCVVVARPTRARSLYVQMIGRGTRRHPGKADCLVLDVTGATSRHDLVTLAGLAGLDPEQVTSQGVTEALTTHRPAVAEEGTWAADLVAQEVSLFRRRPMAWVRAGNRYVLSLGAGFVALEPRADGWAVVQHRRDQPSVLVAQGLSLEWAQGTGEDLARSLGATVLADRSAHWRMRPASEKQLACLLRWRLPVPANITAGEASDLIAARMARRAS